MSENDILKDAMRAQILSEIMRGASSGGRRAQTDEMPDAISMGMTPEDWDYFVDIERRDLPELNAATGKPVGWMKKVHRFTTKKGEKPPKPGKKRSGSN